MCTHSAHLPGTALNANGINLPVFLSTHKSNITEILDIIPFTLSDMHVLDL